MYDPIKDKVKTEQDVRDEYGIFEAKDLAIIKAIKGDTADDVPSIKRFPTKVCSRIASKLF